MSELTVDVIVATNRYGPFLDEALASVRSQTWPHWRIIVVDDGSPEPESVRRSCARIPGTVYVRQNASGVSAARNAGVRRATGNLLAFLDDDDVWHPERLALQVRALTENPDALGAYSGGWYMDATGTAFGSGWPAVEGTRDQFLSGEVNIPSIGTLLVRRDATDALGGLDESLIYAEDDDFTLRLIQRGPLVGVPRQLIGYRRHDDNATSAPAALRYRSSERFLGAQIRRAAQSGDTQTAGLLRRNLVRFRRRSAEGWVGRLVVDLRRRDARAAVQDAWWSWTRDPAAAFGGAVGRVATRIRRRV